ncbi:hypothetical protein Tco_0963312 [Tanacetum coccineum]
MAKDLSDIRGELNVLTTAFKELYVAGASKDMLFQETSEDEEQQQEQHQHNLNSLWQSSMQTPSGEFRISRFNGASGPTMSFAYLSRSSSIITSENEPQAALAPEIQGVANQSYTGDSQLRVLHDNDQVNRQLPSFSSAFPRGGNSTTSGFLSSDNRSAVHEAAPGVDGFGRESTNDAPVNPQDVVGISLVGRRFKDVNPTAYYVERN